MAEDEMIASSRLRRMANARVLVSLCLVTQPLSFRTPEAVRGSGQAATQTFAAPAPTARIVDFNVSSDGTLRIRYSDRAIVEMPLERGRFRFGDEVLAQTSFSDVQIGADRRHIGWAAQYLACAQSYPCSTEVVVFRTGRKPVYVGPDAGVIWSWCFWANDSRVVVHSGFPHGDATGTYTLYDSESGRVVEVFSSETTRIPEWVQRLRSREP